MQRRATVDRIGFPGRVGHARLLSCTGYPQAQPGSARLGPLSTAYGIKNGRVGARPFEPGGCESNARGHGDVIPSLPGSLQPGSRPLRPRKTSSEKPLQAGADRPAFRRVSDHRSPRRCRQRTDRHQRGAASAYSCTEIQLQTGTPRQKRRRPEVGVAWQSE